jgi:serine/threonine protein kinase/Tfp pilus assembly protein PilF
MIGKTISHYKIIEEIGRGGMGTVYKAEDTKLKRIVALKFLPELGDERQRLRFTREAQAAAALDHPNICSVHEIEEAEGYTFISMTYCEGNTLKQLAERGNLGLKEILDIVIQIAQGLVDAHDKGIVHRDIKPANIMVSDKLQARIMDFGLARLEDQIGVTRTGSAVGTILYMSPEQMRGDAVDSRSDIWSLGVVLYELVTGVHPFHGEYEASTIYAILNNSPDPIEKRVPDVPDGLSRILDRALNKESERRYQRIDAMLEDLELLRENLGSPTSLPRRRRDIKRYTLRGAAILAAATVLAIAVYAYLSTLTFRLPQEPISVAVVDFENRTTDPDFSCLTDLLITDLEQCSYLDIMSRQRFDELRRNAGAQSLDDSTAFALSGMAGIQTIIFPRILQFGQSYRINASVFNVSSRRLLFDKAVQGKGPDNIFDMIDELLAMIKTDLKDLDIIPSGEADHLLPLKQLTTGSMAAYKSFAKGDSLYNSGNQLKAIPYIERAVEIDSTFVPALRVLALLYDYMGDRERSTHCAHKAKELSRELGEKEFITSVITEYVVLKNWDRAIEYMSLLLELDPNDAMQYYRMGFYLSSYKKEHSEAIELFEKALELDPNNLTGRRGPIYNSLGNAYLFSGDRERAMDCFECYRNSAKDSPDPLHSIAFADLYTGNYAEASLRLEEVTERFPNFYIAHQDLGMSELARGKWYEAIASFEQYIECAPQGARPCGHVNIAYVHFIQENIPLAMKEIEKALNIDPFCTSAHWLRGIIDLDIFGDTGNARLALRVMQERASISEFTIEAAYYENLNGRILIAEGYYDKGIESLLRASERAPSKFLSFKKDLVKGYLAAGLAERAIEECEKLLDLNNRDAESFCLLARAFEMAEQPLDAEISRSRALEIWEDADPGFCPMETLSSQGSL